MEAVRNPPIIPPWAVLLAGLLSRVAKKVRPVTLTERELRLVEKVRRSATRAAGLLEAADLEDLGRRLDELVGQTDIYFFDMEGTVAADPGELDGLLSKGELDLDDLVVRLGGAAYPVVEGFGHLREVGRAFGHMARAGHISQPEAIADAADPLSFVTSPDFPPEIGLALLSAVKGSLSLLAITYLLFDEEKRVEPWLLHALAVRWSDGSYQMLRAVGSAPEARVPEALLPSSDRFDLEALERETARGKRELAELFEQARASGLEVYPPLSFHDDE